MAKKSVILAPAVRSAVTSVIQIRKAKGLQHNKWSQAEHAVALAFFASGYDAALGDEITPEGKLPGAVKTLLASATAEGQDTDHGFLGNASQFRQALEALPEGDDLHLPKSAAAGGYE